MSPNAELLIKYSWYIEWDKKFFSAFVSLFHEVDTLERSGKTFRSAVHNVSEMFLIKKIDFFKFITDGKF